MFPPNSDLEKFVKRVICGIAIGALVIFVLGLVLGCLLF